MGVLGRLGRGSGLGFSRRHVVIVRNLGELEFLLQKRK